MDNIEFIKGENIYLRSLNLDDAEGNYSKWLNDKEVCLGNSHYRFPQTKDALKQYISSVNMSKDKLVLAIVDNKKNNHIGNITLQSINWINRTAEFAIVLGEKEYWGKKIGLQAAILIISHGFDELNLERIYLGTYENNIGMQKLAESLGFVKEGVRRNADFKNGKYIDVIEYGLLKKEFIKK